MVLRALHVNKDTALKISELNNGIEINKRRMAGNTIFVYEDEDDEFANQFMESEVFMNHYFFIGKENIIQMR